jgi:HemY protein
LRAVLLTARAMELEAGHPDEARAQAVEAHRLAPDLVAAAVVAARLLTRAGDIGRATRLLETAWKAAPHPEIAEAYAAVRPGDSVRDRLKRVRRLADMRANHPQGGMAVARAAIDAHDWQAARNALGGLMRAEPTERMCLLMAEIEEGEHGDQGRVRAWLRRALSARRDPVWTADGHVFDHWAPVSPISGRVDAFEWRVVAEQLPPPRALDIDVSERLDGAGAAIGAPAALPAEPLVQPKDAAPAAPAVAAQPRSAVPPGDVRSVAPAARPEQVQPSPDDPGPLTPGDERARRFGVI